MGLLKFYYDAIILDKFNSSNEQDFLLKEWNPDEKPIEQTQFYLIVSNEILKKYNFIYEDKLKLQIWKVIRSLRRIILHPEEIQEQFKKLLEINKTLPEQRTPEWYAFRENLITASSWGNVFGWVGSAKEVLLQKLGHEGSQFKGNEFTRWGTKYEPVATSIYEKRTGKTVIDFGCLRHPDENNFFIGASPDGIADDGVMLEIKCPPRREIGPIPTDYYWAQMQGQLEVCNLERCDFLECKIFEYQNEEDYIEELDENCESGVVLTFKKNDDLIYRYSDFFIKGQELTDWIVKNIKENKELEFVGPSYWKLVKYQCQPVFRDREWFEWAREQLKNFYDQWQFYKKHGYDSLISERQIKPKQVAKTMESTSLTDYDGFTVVSETGEETEVLVKKFTKFGFSTPVPEKKIEFMNNDEEVIITPKRFGFSTQKSNDEVIAPKRFGFR